jgi:hypothetical protein
MIVGAQETPPIYHQILMQSQQACVVMITMITARITSSDPSHKDIDESNCLDYEQILLQIWKDKIANRISEVLTA